jgi:hypothetical protein
MLGSAAVSYYLIFLLTEGIVQQQGVVVIRANQ